MKLIVSGISIWLPGQSNPGRPCDLDQTRIENLSESQLLQLKDYNSNLNSPSAKSVLPSIQNIQNIKETYGIQDYVVDSCDEVGLYAILSGLEAIQDAGINIYSSTQRLTGLYPELQQTGVISVGMFPSIISTMEAFDRKKEVHKTHLHKMIVRPNSHFSQLIKAKGPSVHIDTACCSTVSALGLAEDWLRLDRCDRVIIIGSDNPGDDRIFPMIASGFHRLGVLTTKQNPHPFDPSRSGFVLGSCAIGMVIEKKDTIHPGQVELFHVELGNSAFLTLSLDEEYMADILKRMMDQVSERINMSFKDLSKNMIYLSHETSTPRCAISELYALRHVFKEHIQNIIICGVKGICGHALGTNYEEIIAVDILRQNKLPPIIGLEIPDPSLGNDLMFSNGSGHCRTFVLRCAAGFGSSIGYSLYRKNISIDL
jgi:3-oxoacyl-(acyl-carrier-protein) synthase